MGIAIALGMLVGLGVVAILVGLRPGHARLGDALAVLDPRSPITSDDTPHPTRAWLRIPVSAEQQRLLAVQGREVTDFHLEKLILAGAGLLLPGLWTVLQLLFGNAVSLWPLLAVPAAGLVGWCIPDVTLRRGRRRHSRAMTDALHTFFDLVALERLANASAVQATTSAAAISEAPLFRRITVGCERARMQQVAPWDELRAIAKEWQVPELADFADVMQLEEQGAGLAEVLQARVKELRDAHLTRMKIEAGAVSERMTIWMTIPAMLLGLAFLVPALLRITTM